MYPFSVYSTVHFNKKLGKGWGVRMAVIPMLSCLEFLHFIFLFEYLYNNSNWIFLASLFNLKIPSFLRHPESKLCFSSLLLHMALTTFHQLFLCILFAVCPFLSISSMQNPASNNCSSNMSIQL